jgi:glycosyltransferase involved in cell wall biosynthesis
MTRVLASSAAYVLTDHSISSEGQFCYDLFKNMGGFGYFFEAISEYIKIRTPLENANFYQVGSLEALPQDKTTRKYMAHLEFITHSYLKSRKILKEKEVDIIHHILPAVHDQTFSLLAMRGKKVHQPFVFGPLSSHFYARPLDEKLLMKITSVLHRKTMARCDRLIAITNQVKRVYSRIVDEDKVRVIPFGVETETFKPSVKQASRDNKEILFVGYLYKLKGVEYLIRAFSLVEKEQRNILLRIVGKGQEMDNLKRLAKTLQIESKVVFEGFIPQFRLAKYYQNCDIFCLPTLGEPFGKVILEAMACGKPIVASNIGGPSEIVENGKNGFLVPPAQPTALAERILEILEDESKMRQFGINARKSAVQKYS